jgi:hypothetical protein
MYWINVIYAYPIANLRHFLLCFMIQLPQITSCVLHKIMIFLDVFYGNLMRSKIQDNYSKSCVSFTPEIMDPLPTLTSATIYTKLYTFSCFFCIHFTPKWTERCWCLVWFARLESGLPRSGLNGPAVCKTVGLSQIGDCLAYEQAR